ncbi:MAG: hypothetical protein ABL949_13800 [Fimbriimonadaceae bacterium]
MSADEDLGFSYTVDASVDVRIFRHSKFITILRKQRAVNFLRDVEAGSDAVCQQLMARVTGHYKHGNERLSKDHPRNR